MSEAMERLLFLAAETRPAMPPTSLLKFLGPWGDLYSVVAANGLLGAVETLSGTDYAQLTEMYARGVGCGASPRPEEFYHGLTLAIGEALCNSELPITDRMKMFAKLDAWYEGRSSGGQNAVLGFDAEVEAPAFTLTGWWPLDRVAGSKGMPQDVITIISAPGTGKTTIGCGLAADWKRNVGGPVMMFQTELGPSMMRRYTDAALRPGEKLWTPEDKIVYGSYAVQEQLDWCICNPDPDRLIIFDSVSSFCGDGSDAASRTRYFKAYQDLMAVKNASRMAVAMTHTKRGVDPDTDNMESSAGSASIERFSGLLLYLTPLERGEQGTRELSLKPLKNRHDQLGRPVKFLMNYHTSTPSELRESYVESEDL